MGVVFTDFVNDFNQISKRGRAYKTLSKLMINSLYGRVGMREPEYHSFVVKCEGRRNVKKQNKRKIGNVFGKQKKTV